MVALVSGFDQGGAWGCGAWVDLLVLFLLSVKLNRIVDKWALA